MCFVDAKGTLCVFFCFLITNTCGGRFKTRHTRRFPGKLSRFSQLIFSYWPNCTVVLLKKRKKLCTSKLLKEFFNTLYNTYLVFVPSYFYVFCFNNFDPSVLTILAEDAENVGSSTGGQSSVKRQVFCATKEDSF